MSNSPSSKVTGVTSINTSRFDTASLDDAVNTNIPNLVADLTALRTTIDSAQTSAVVGDLTFTPGGSGPAEQNAGLTAYKAQLSSISTTITTLIVLLNNNINGNASLLITQILAVRTDSTNTIVFF